MEPAALLFVEVFGMITIAGCLTLALVRDPSSVESAEQEQVPKGLPLLSTTLLCPTWGIGAEVALGLDHAGPKPMLEVLSCDLLLDTEKCDQPCVGGIARA